MSGSDNGKKTITLANGVEIPTFGFGCAFGDWSSEGRTNKAIFSPEDAWTQVPRALRAGVRHLDTAFCYRTHRAIGATLGAAFRKGELKRDEVFVTTKVFHPAMPRLYGKTIDLKAPDVLETVQVQVRRDIYASLDELQLGWVDLLLVHWPGDFGSTDRAFNRRLRLLVWRVMEEALDRGMARAIGVSNFTEQHLADLAEDGAVVTPHVNQIEVNPYTQWTAIQEYCQANGVLVQAWSPMGSTGSSMLRDELLVALAEKYGKNPGQIVLRWLVQQDMGVLPRSSNEARIASNMDVFDFEISEADMAAITALTKGRSLTNPSPYDIA
uniref:NADP-dependent oxidoreductase domain-containing protein n=1 Tax=Phaeomonas parva TaxID=124430 RepID=A0A7S1UDJ3_9STRA